MQYVSLGISIVTGIICVLTFFYSRNDTTKQDDKEDKEEAKSTQYKWGVMETKLDNVSRQVDKILDKLEINDKEVDAKIKFAIEEHEKHFHNK